MSGDTISPRHACVIGWPIGHSRSPMIHTHWIEKHGIDGTYTAKEVAPQDLAAFFEEMRSGAYVGCNVTMPHKEAVLQHLDVIDPFAKTVGAVNTVWVEDGRLHGMNTDGIGFLAHLDQTVPDWRARPVSGVTYILGAGGAARGIATALLDAGVRSILIGNRTVDRAKELVCELRHQFPDDGPAQSIAWTTFDELEGDTVALRLLVNATSLGMKGQPPVPQISWHNVVRSAIVYDIVYAPLETELLASARNRDLDTVDGLGMLLHQAVPGFEKWFGVRPEVTPELRALIEADL